MPAISRSALWASLLFFLPLWGLAQRPHQTDTLYLSGTGSDNTVDWRFQCTGGRNSGEWSSIAVPSCWELEGFGTYNYGKDPEEQKADEKGIYKHIFMVPDHFKDRSVELVFEGSMTDTKVQINGQDLSPIHQGSFYRFKYEVSDYLKPGRSNSLRVEVSKQSANRSVNLAERHADYWIFGGIFRPVYLAAHPEAHIEHFSHTASMEGDIQVFPELSEEARETKGSLRMALFNAEGQQVLEESIEVPEEGPLPALKGHLEQAKRWNPEQPYLYQLHLLLLDEAGDTLHHRQESIGFRTLEVRKKRGIFLNGQRIHFRGINRHSFHPESGRTTNPALSKKDVRLMKQLNLNAVRMSHYPPDEHFLDQCDQQGLLVINELAGWHDAYDTEVGEKLVREMVRRDVNHPSVVVWANGNEGGSNFALDDDFGQHDPQNRPVIHSWAVHNGLDCSHYKPYLCCDDRMFRGGHVFFPTEFLHGQFDGGMGAGLEDFWEKMYDHPLSAGGFLWVFSDEGVVRTDWEKDSLDVNKGQAPDGILGPYREKEGSFWAVREIWSPVHFPYDELTEDFDGAIPVENRFYFTNFNDCRFRWYRYDLPEAGSQAGRVLLDSGQVQADPLVPGQKGQLQLQMPENPAADLLEVRVWGPQGGEILTKSYMLKKPRQFNAGLLAKSPAPQAKITETREGYLISQGKYTWSFGFQGLLKGISNGQQNYELRGGPNFTDTMETNVDYLKIGPEGQRLFVHFKTPESDNGNFTGLTELSFEPVGEGWLKINYSYNLKRGRHPYHGISFNYPERFVKGVRWVGRGPYRVWKNRMQGQQFGLWQKDYKDVLTGHQWDYPEFKGYHANFYWLELNTEEGDLLFATADQDVFARLYTPRLKSEGAWGHVGAKFPSGSLSFMHGIAPMGSKFHEPEELGPQSQPNILLSDPYTPVSYSGTLFLKAR